MSALLIHQIVPVFFAIVCVLGRPLCGEGAAATWQSNMERTVGSPGEPRLDGSPSLLGVDGESSPVSFNGSKKKGPGELVGNDWLRWWEARHSSFQLTSAWMFLYSPAQGDIDAAVRAFRSGAARTSREKVELLMRVVRDRYRDDPNKVCRHHAMLFYKVAIRLGFAVQYRCFIFGTRLQDGHSWNRVKISGASYVVDSFNGLMYPD